MTEDSLYSRIVCPTDFSPASRAPLEEALRLRERFRAHLTVLHVIHETALDDDEDDDEEMRAFHEELEQKAEERMQSLVPAEERDDVDCLILRGQPVREILRTALEGEADLLVIGSHGMSGTEGARFGSTGQAVLLLSPLPVLVVKPEGYTPTIE